VKPTAALWRLAISVVVAIVLLILVVNVITQPVSTDMRSYTAEFTDASGLHVGADVRVRGVRVGKVESVDLRRRDGQSIAAVGFTLDKRYGVVSAARLAIKYQALTGLRYVDVVNPSETYSTADLVARVPTTMTQPSFDITTLFNGLQPVFATLSPDQLNTFMANAASFLSGDGGGLAPMLDSIRKLTEFVSDRQQVVATLMRNLSNVADAVGGHSKDLIQILDWLNRPIDAALTVLDEFRKSQLYGPDFTTAVIRLLNNAGFKPGIDIDAALDRAFTNVDDAINAFKLVPVMWDNIGPPSAAEAPEPCSRGPAQLPASLDVLLNGQRVVLCNR
jgi:phospholipid/cholesterol/gamma-HCH transport system substrate-binding protein